MTIILSHFILFFFISFFNGYFFLNLFNKSKLELNILEISLIGLIITSLFAQLLNFFVPLNDFVIYFNIFLILIIFFSNKKYFFKKFKINYLIILPIFILTIINIYGSKFSDDLNHYHYSYILNTDNFNYIIGYSFLHHMYGFSSLWLIAHSYFNFDYSRLQDIHVLNGLVLFLILGLFFSKIVDTIKNKKIKIYIPIIFLIIIFILIKYSRIKEFGIDRPAFLLFYYLIYFYIKNFFLTKNQEDKNNIYFLLLICLTVIFIKITFAFIILLPLYLFLKEKKFSLLANKKTTFISLVVLTYLLKNLFISGCLIYPFESLCFESISWNNAEAAAKDSNTSELLNKSWEDYKGNLSSVLYVKNFNWFSTWLARSSVEISEFLFSILISLFAVLVCFNFKKTKKLLKNERYLLYKNKELTYLFSIILILYLILFFLKNPVIRMSHHIFILPTILFILFLMKKKQINIKNNLIIICISAAFIFNASKNIIRIQESNFVNNPKKQIYHSGLVSDPISKKIDNFTYYVGWYGPSPIGNESLEGLNHNKKFIFNIIYKKKL